MRAPSSYSYFVCGGIASGEGEGAANKADIETLVFLNIFVQRKKISSFLCLFFFCNNRHIERVKRVKYVEGRVAEEIFILRLLGIGISFQSGHNYRYFGLRVDERWIEKLGCRMCSGREMTRDGKKGFFIV